MLSCLPDKRFPFSSLRDNYFFTDEYIHVVCGKHTDTCSRQSTYSNLFASITLRSCDCAVIFNSKECRMGLLLQPSVTGLNYSEANPQFALLEIICFSSIVFRGACTVLSILCCHYANSIPEVNF
jgi:hypothetical protein